MINRTSPSREMPLDRATSADVATVRYRVLFAVTRAEYYEIDATDADDAEERAYVDGRQVDRLGNPASVGEGVDAVVCESTVVSPGTPHRFTDADRARRAGAALRAYREHTGDQPCSSDEDLIDILADLRHFADLEGLNFGACDRIAYRHYLEYLGEKGGTR